jgi:hypothetical protein
LDQKNTIIILIKIIHINFINVQNINIICIIYIYILYMNNPNFDNKCIPTRKKRIRYKFITPSIVEDTKPEDKSINYYYQIALFPNIHDHTYHLRRFSFYGKNEFIDVKYYKLNKQQFKKFRKNTLPHKYKGYNTYTLYNINPPTLSDLFTSRSDILRMQYNHSGWSPFHKY